MFYHAINYLKWRFSRLVGVSSNTYNDMIKHYNNELDKDDDLIDFLIDRLYEHGGSEAFDKLPIRAIVALADHFGVDPFDIREELHNPYSEDEHALSTWEGEGGSYVKS